MLGGRAESLLPYLHLRALKRHQGVRPLRNSPPHSTYGGQIVRDREWMNGSEFTRPALATSTTPRRELFWVLLKSRFEAR